MRYQTGNFVVVPNLVPLNVVSAQAQAVFLWICHYANEKGQCFPSMKTLSMNTSLSEHKVRDSMKELVTRQIIEVVYRKQGNRNLTNLYQILCEEVPEQFLLHSSSGSHRERGGTPEEPGVVPTGRTNYIHKTISTETPSSEGEELTYEKLDREGDVIVSRFDKRKPDDNAMLIMQEMETEKNRKFTNPKTQMGKIRVMLDAGYTKKEILEEYRFLEKKHPHWSKVGVDFTIVASNIHKEHD